ncbi:MAG: ankyrin repeat domain-containing protein [Capsulimonas sp.]|uniref:ankyrin repeat domain-containing protein n=1 Tax=Capsulimonas sp. TaxID=2494211 RepID=UPI003266CF8A
MRTSLFRLRSYGALALLHCAMLVAAATPAGAQSDPPAFDPPYSIVKSPYRGATITSQAFSPDGRVLAIGMTDGTAALYDLRAKRWTVHTKRLQSGGVQAVVLSPDGALLAASGDDDHVNVVDARTGADLRRLPAKTAALSLAFSPDGKSLAAGLLEDYEGISSVRLWSVPSLRVQRDLNTEGAVFALSFSATGERLLASASESTVFTMPAGKKIWSHDNMGARSDAISPDGKIVGGGLGIWSVAAKKRIAEGGGQTNFSGFSRTGAILISGSEEDGTAVYDGHTGKKLSDLKLFRDFCAVSPDGALIADGYGMSEVALHRIDEKALRKLAYERAHPTPKQIVQKSLADAIEHGDLVKVKLALAKGANPNMLYSEYVTLLRRAASGGNPEIFQTLVAAGASFKPKDPQFAHLILAEAVSSKNIPMVQWLLDQGVSIPHDEEFPLLFSAADGAPMCAFLLDHGAAIDARERIHGDTALMQAAEQGKSEVVKLLLGRGADAKLMTFADPSDKDYVPVNALTYAVMSGDFATVAPLADATSNLNDPASFRLPLAILASNPKSAAILTLLLDKGADPNARDTTPDSDNDTALISAARHGFVLCAAALIAHHADINAKNNNGKTALDLCTDDAIAKMLTNAGHR